MADAVLELDRVDVAYHGDMILIGWFCVIVWL
jgi:hypothetical protein